MTTTAVVAVKPKFAERIYAGTKLYEYRRRFNRAVTKALIYESAPISAITGEFAVEYIRRYSKPTLWEQTGRNGGITKDEFFDYFHGVSAAFAIKIKSATKYEQPKRLSDIGLKHAPQSYVFVREEAVGADELEIKDIEIKELDRQGGANV